MKQNKAKGRPVKKVNLQRLKILRDSGLSYRRLAKVMKISVKTVIKNLDLVS